MFFLPNVTIKIIKHDFDKTEYPRHEQDSVQQKRQMSSVQMVKELQKIYSQMMLTNQKYLDPSSILKKIVDEFGDRVKIGDEQDIGEFAMNFLDRMEEGIGETRKFKDDT
jgi:ubiquitin carboxyl-terminal hydrolase 25/28